MSYGRCQECEKCHRRANSAADSTKRAGDVLRWRPMRRTYREVTGPHIAAGMKCGGASRMIKEWGRTARRGSSLLVAVHRLEPLDGLQHRLAVPKGRGAHKAFAARPETAARGGHDVALLQDLGKHVPRLLACITGQYRHNRSTQRASIKLARLELKVKRAGQHADATSLIGTAAADHAVAKAAAPIYPCWTAGRGTTR